MALESLMVERPDNRLKGCPFCGRQPRQSSRALSESDAKYHGMNYIAFRACFGNGYSAHAYMAGLGATPDAANAAADAAWNTRETESN